SMVLKAKQRIWAVVLCWAAMKAVQTQAIAVGPLGSKGEGGTKNGQSLQVGAGGSVYELDAFLSVQGQDLNGSQVGTSAQLSQNSLPLGMLYNFSWALSSNKADLVLTYTFSNTTSTV